MVRYTYIKFIRKADDGAVRGMKVIMGKEAKQQENEERSRQLFLGLVTACG